MTKSDFTTIIVVIVLVALFITGCYFKIKDDKVKVSKYQKGYDLCNHKHRK